MYVRYILNMIIDSHVHLHTESLLIPLVNSRKYFDRKESNADFLVALADKVGVDKIMCSHMMALVYDMQEGNMEVVKAIDKFPDRVIGYFSIPNMYHDGEFAAKELERFVRTYGFKGLKILHTWEVNGDWTIGNVVIRRRLDSEDFYPIVQKAADLKIPILCHASVDECKGIIETVPDAMLMIAHSGRTISEHGMWSEAIELAKKHDSILLETCSSSWNTGLLERAADAVGAERIIFGTDSPVLNPFPQIDAIKQCDLSNKQKELILGGNMSRILGLKDR